MGVAELIILELAVKTILYPILFFIDKDAEKI